MRKFVIKNRQKRKYTRKTKTQSFSFSKTIYDVIPLIILVIIFMVTVVILPPLRNSLTHIQITFQTPEISFRNPVSFFQTFTQTIQEIGLTIVTITMTIMALLSQAMNTFAQDTVTFSNSLWDNIILGVSELTTASLTLIQLFSLIGTIVISGIYFVLSFVGKLFSFIIQMNMVISLFLLHLFLSVIIFLAQQVTSILVTTWNIFNAASLVVVHAIIVAAVFLFTTLITICELVWHVLVTTLTVITSAISYGITSVINVIEIPFKILYAFWLQIKPSVDALGHYLRLSCNDFANGFISLEKMGAVLSSRK